MILFDNYKNNLNFENHFSIEDSIPIVELDNNGLLRSINNVYSKSYKLLDINYKLNDREEQRDILDHYKTMLNQLDDTQEFSFSIFNTKLSDSFMDDYVYFKNNGDGLDKYRNAYNDVIKRNIINDKKAFTKEKIVTVSIEANKYEDALKNMKILDEILRQGIEDINGAKLQEMNATEMLKYLHSIYNIKKKNNYSDKTFIGKKEVEVFTMKNAIKQGISAKELVQPTNMSIFKDYIRLGDTYIRCLYIENINKQIDTECIDKICSVDFNLLLTCRLKQIDMDMALKMTKEELNNVEGYIADDQQKLNHIGASIDLVPRDLKQRRDEAIDINESLNIRDEKLFNFSMYALLFADNLQELKENEEKFKKLARGKGLYFFTGIETQENIFNSALPYGINQTNFKRTIDTEGAAAFIPFYCQDIIQKGGDFFGVNKLTHNPILYDQMSGDSYSTIILGKTGKGKSFKSKEVTFGKRLRNAYRYTMILDPNNEWGDLTREIGGQEVIVTSGGEYRLNLFDIDGAYGENPLADKEDFIILITKLMLHSPFGLSAGQTTTISKAVSQIYSKWAQTEKEEDIPTIEDYYEALLHRANETKQAEDFEICKAIEYYCKESQNTLFRGHTNIDFKKPVISFNLKDLGSSFKPLCMQVLMDCIWNSVCKNRYKGVVTDLIIDEFHLMFNGEADTAIWMSKFWKMFRKFLGCPVGITQNPTDLLKSEEGRTVLSNTAINILLSLDDTDREIIKSALSLTNAQLKYITNQPSGEGLVCIHASRAVGENNVVIPFKNKFPEDEGNLIYDLINTTQKR